MMKQLFLCVGISLFAVSVLFSQGYKVGDKASDFKLKNVDGKQVSLASFPNAKGFVVIFTCNHCPYAKAYEDRIIEIDKKYKVRGFPVVAINPNDPQAIPEDSYEAMITRATQKGFTYPYLIDETQEVYQKYGAQRTPHVFLLEKKGSSLIVRYIGAIDDNYQDATKVTAPYLRNAIDAVLAGKIPDPDFTKAIGCSIKEKPKRT
jgi:peroxiredoxin